MAEMNSSTKRELQKLNSTLKDPLTTPRSSLRASIFRILPANRNQAVAQKPLRAQANSAEDSALIAPASLPSQPLSSPLPPPTPFPDSCSPLPVSSSCSSAPTSMSPSLPPQHHPPSSSSSLPISSACLSLSLPAVSHPPLSEAGAQVVIEVGGTASPTQVLLSSTLPTIDSEQGTSSQTNREAPHESTPSKATRSQSAYPLVNGLENEARKTRGKRQLNMINQLNTESAKNCCACKTQNCVAEKRCSCARSHRNCSNCKSPNCANKHENRGADKQMVVKQILKRTTSTAGNSRANSSERRDPNTTPIMTEMFLKLVQAVEQIKEDKPETYTRANIVKLQSAMKFIRDSLDYWEVASTKAGSNHHFLQQVRAFPDNAPLIEVLKLTSGKVDPIEYSNIDVNKLEHVKSFLTANENAKHRASFMATATSIIAAEDRTLVFTAFKKLQNIGYIGIKTPGLGDCGPHAIVIAKTGCVTNDAAYANFLLRQIGGLISIQKQISNKNAPVLEQNEVIPPTVILANMFPSKHLNIEILPPLINYVFGENVSQVVNGNNNYDGPVRVICSDNEVVELYKEAQLGEKKITILYYDNHYTAFVPSHTEFLLSVSELESLLQRKLLELKARVNGDSEFLVYSKAFEGSVGSQLAFICNQQIYNRASSTGIIRSISNEDLRQKIFASMETADVFMSKSQSEKCAAELTKGDKYSDEDKALVRKFYEEANDFYVDKKAHIDHILNRSRSQRHIPIPSVKGLTRYIEPQGMPESTDSEIPKQLRVFANCKNSPDSSRKIDLSPPPLLHPVLNYSAMNSNNLISHTRLQNSRRRVVYNPLGNPPSPALFCNSSNKCDELDCLLLHRCACPHGTLESLCKERQSNLASRFYHPTLNNPCSDFRLGKCEKFACPNSHNLSSPPVYRSYASAVNPAHLIPTSSKNVYPSHNPPFPNHFKHPVPTPNQVNADRNYMHDRSNNFNQDRTLSTRNTTSAGRISNFVTNSHPSHAYFPRHTASAGNVIARSQNVFPSNHLAVAIPHASYVGNNHVVSQNTAYPSPQNPLVIANHNSEMKFHPNPAPPARNTSPMGNNNQFVSQNMLSPPPHYPSAMANYNFETNAHPNPSFSARNTSSDENNHYFIPTPQNQTFSPHNVPLTVANHNYDSNPVFSARNTFNHPPASQYMAFHPPNNPQSVENYNFQSNPHPNSVFPARNPSHVENNHHFIPNSQFLVFPPDNHSTSGINNNFQNFHPNRPHSPQSTLTAENIPNLNPAPHQKPPVCMFDSSCLNPKCKFSHSPFRPHPPKECRFGNTCRLGAGCWYGHHVNSSLSH